MTTYKPIVIGSSGLADFQEISSSDTLNVPTLTTTNRIAATYLPTDLAFNDANNLFTAHQSPSTAGSKDLGTALLPWGNLYVGGAATNNNKVTSATTTGARVFTLPDANSNSIVPLGSATSNQWIQYVDSSGVQHLSQPASSNLSDAANIALVNNANNFSTAQLPSAFGTIDLGSTTKPWRDVYVADNGGTKYTKVTNTALTNNRTLTLPNADSNTVIPDTGASNNFLTAISAGGVISKAQPAFSNLSGSVAASQMPALTGDITTSAGAVATTLATVNSNVGTYTLATITVNAKGLVTAASNGAASSGFGGDGSDGAISNPTSVTAPKQINATTWSLTGANTYTVTSGPLIINCNSTFTLGDGTNASTITVTAGAGASGGAGAPTVGGRGNGGTNGAGPGSGQGDHLGVNTSAGNRSGGGGAGFGGAGGNGGGGDGGGGASNAGQTYQSWMNGGSGGGGGSNGESSGTGGNGGNGGGALIVCAKGAISCTANSVINCKGGNGTAATTAGGGGGGGSGGLVFLASQTSVTVAGTINVSGGNGGNATGTGGGGGGGGAGRIICWSPTNTTGSATFTMSGGTHGNNAGSQTDGNDGSSGTQQSITGTPNLPLFA